MWLVCSPIIRIKFIIETEFSDRCGPAVSQPSVNAVYSSVSTSFAMKTADSTNRAAPDNLKQPIIVNSAGPADEFIKVVSQTPREPSHVRFVNAQPAGQLQMTSGQTQQAASNYSRCRLLKPSYSMADASELVKHLAI